MPAGGLFESQVLPPGLLLWNQLSGADGRMRKRHLLEDMQRRYVSVMGGASPAEVKSKEQAAREGKQESGKK